MGAKSEAMAGRRQFAGPSRPFSSRGSRPALSRTTSWQQLDEGQSEAIPDETDQELQEELRLLFAKVIESFGGQIERFGKGVRHFYRVKDGKTLNIKYSKRHSDYYWFGVHVSLWEEMAKKGVTHMVFILMPGSFVTVPLSVLKDYIAKAGFSPKSDGTVRHYHVLISLDPSPDLFYHGKTDRIPLTPYIRQFDL